MVRNKFEVNNFFPPFELNLNFFLTLNSFEDRSMSGSRKLSLGNHDPTLMYI